MSLTHILAPAASSIAGALSRYPRPLDGIAPTHRVYRLPQGHDGGGPAAGFGRCSAEPGDEIGAGQDSSNGFALDADAAAVNDAHAAKAALARLIEVFFDGLEPSMPTLCSGAGRTPPERGFTLLGRCRMP